MTPDERYTGEAPAPTAPTLHQTILYQFNEAMRRGWHGMRGLTDDDLNRDPGHGAMSIGQLLQHQLHLIRSMTNTLQPGSTADLDAVADVGEKGAWRLQAIKTRREALGERFREVFAAVSPESMMGKRPPEVPPARWAEWPVLMRVLRPLTDLATHVGQVNYARRQLGKPVGS